MADTVTAPETLRDDDAPGLKADAIGFVDALVIGLASTAPAYSLAAIIGSVTVIVGVQAPAALLASFVPMFLIAGAFFYMNRADPDAGTTFSWVTRAIGPWAGWLGGWAVCTTGILVIGSLADVGARYSYLLFGADGAAGSKVVVTITAVALIVVMTAICIIGTEALRPHPEHPHHRAGRRPARVHSGGARSRSTRATASRPRSSRRRPGSTRSTCRASAR